jgi:cytochrome c oxidase subunit 2
MPVLASEHGLAVDKFIIYVHWLMIVLFVGWFAYFCYCLWRFRATRNPKADHLGVRSHISNYIEAVVVIAEVILLAGFAVPLWSSMATASNFPKESESTVVHVVAQQFSWNCRYPGVDGAFGRQDFKLVDAAKNPFGLDLADPASKDDFTTVNDLHVPVNKPVIIQVTSKDVIHSFKVIAMRITQDAIPGLKIPTHFTPTKVGTYQINCAQLCGGGHAAMTAGRLVVDSPENYTKWVISKSAGAGAPANLE